MKRDEFNNKTKDEAATRENGNCELCGITFGEERPD
jgi:hypothetical protein